jgi:hypothetical protein
MQNWRFKAEISSFLILPSAFQVSLVTPAATHIDETKNPFRFCRKGRESSNLN